MGRVSAIVMRGEWGPRYGCIRRFWERCITIWVVLGSIRVHVRVVERIDWIRRPAVTGGRHCLPRQVAAAKDEGIASVSLYGGARVDR